MGSRPMLVQLIGTIKRLTQPGWDESAGPNQFAERLKSFVATLLFRDARASACRPQFTGSLSTKPGVRWSCSMDTDSGLIFDGSEVHIVSIAPSSPWANKIWMTNLIA